MNRSIYDLIFLDITITYNYIYNIFRENLKIFLFCFEIGEIFCSTIYFHFSSLF